MLVKKILVLIFEMLVGIIKVIILRSGKRSPFIPLPLDSSALANFGTDL